MTAAPQSHEPVRRPSDALLADYAAGTCDEARSLILASHLTLCPDSRNRLALLEDLGGALLDEIEPAPLDAASLDALWQRLEDEQPEDTGPVVRRVPVIPPANSVPGEPPMPVALAAYLGRPLQALDWRPLVRGVDEWEVPLAGGGARAKLVRAQPGAAIPAHTHDGEELTLVLGGAFSDSAGRYGPGDLSANDESVDHSPIAEAGEVCYCLLVMDGPLRLTGPIGRFLNPFLKF